MKKLMFLSFVALVCVGFMHAADKWSDMRLADQCEENKEYKKALEIYSKYSNNAHAAYRAGCIYVKLGSDKTAEEFFKIAAKKKHSQASLKLGYYYKNKGEQYRALQCFIAAHKRGSIDALPHIWWLDPMYGYSADPDRWLRLAAEKGNVHAMRMLGILGPMPTERNQSMSDEEIRMLQLGVSPHEAAFVSRIHEQDAQVEFR